LALFSTPFSEKTTTLDFENRWLIRIDYYIYKLTNSLITYFLNILPSLNC
jgi:hypothetical protein